MPGVVSRENGRISLADNIHRQDGMEVGAELRRRLDMAVDVQNDVNLAALGERWRGLARGRDDFAFLSVGTGLGTGLVLRGELHSGHHGAAGEAVFVNRRG